MVKNINKLNFKVELTTRPSKLHSHKDEVNSFKENLDDYFLLSTLKLLDLFGV